MNIFTWLRARYTWMWVGTVEGRVWWAEYNIIECVYWDLFESQTGRRKVKKTGDWRYRESAHMMEALAQVRLWRKGGPLPELYRRPREKASAKLIVFNGGK